MSSTFNIPSKKSEPIYSKNPILALLRKFDYLFGRPFNFTISGKEKYESSIGGISTILVLATCILACWYYGKELWEKKEPTFVRYPKIDFNSTMQVPSSHFVAYDLRELRGLNLTERIRYAYFDTNHVRWYQNATGDWNRTLSNNDLVLPCNDTLEDKSLLNYTKIKSSYCVDFKDKVFGSNGTYTGYFTSYLRKCNEKRLKDKYNMTITCANDTEFQSKFQNNRFFIEMYDQDTLIDPFDYKNPISHSFRYKFWKLHCNQSLWLNDDYKKSEFSSNNAILFEEDWDNRTAIEPGSQITNPNPVENDTFLRHKFWTFSVKIIYKREYITASFVLAEVGGIFGIVIQVFTIISAILVEPRYNQWILKELTNSYIQQIEERNSNSNIDVRKGLSGNGNKKYMELINRIGLSKVKGESKEGKEQKDEKDEKDKNKPNIQNKDLEMQIILKNKSNIQNKDLDLQSLKSNKSNKSNKSQGILNNLKNLNMANNQNDSNIPIFQNANANQRRKSLNSSSKKVKAEISYIHILKHLYLAPCIKAKNSHTKIRYEVIDKANQYIHQKSDMLYLFKHYDEFEIIKKLVLDGNIQLFMHNHRRDKEIITKFKINKEGKDDDEIVFINPSEGGLINQFEDIKATEYLRSKNKYKLLKKNDRILYENMNDDIRTEIEKEE